MILLFLSEEFFDSRTWTKTFKQGMQDLQPNPQSHDTGKACNGSGNGNGTGIAYNGYVNGTGIACNGNGNGNGTGVACSQVDTWMAHN